MLSREKAFINAESLAESKTARGEEKMVNIEKGFYESID